MTTNGKILIVQIVISKERMGGRQKLPYIFTKQGVAILPGVLRSDIAIKTSIQIISAFVSMSRFIVNGTSTTSNDNDFILPQQVVQE